MENEKFNSLSKDEKVAECMRLIDLLVDKERSKNAEEHEKLKALEDAVSDLAVYTRELVPFIRGFITDAVDTNLKDQEALNDMTCALWMIPKLLEQFQAEVEKAEYIVWNYGIVTTESKAGADND